MQSMPRCVLLAALGATLLRTTADHQLSLWSTESVCALRLAMPRASSHRLASSTQSTTANVATLQGRRLRRVLREPSRSNSPLRPMFLVGTRCTNVHGAPARLAVATHQ